MNPTGAIPKRELNHGEKELFSLKVLLHCRTVVEKQNFVSTGILTNVEGELFEIELNEYALFELGETVKLTIYSPAGIQTVQSIVFARYDGAIAVIQPPTLQRRFEEKREHVRVDAEGTARILRIHGIESLEAIGIQEPLEVELRDISLGGLGFLTADLPDIARSAKLTAEVRLEFEFTCELEIMRRERMEGQWFFGAKMVLPDEDALRPLRAYVLRQQVRKNVELRKLAMHAKAKS